MQHQQMQWTQHYVPQQAAYSSDTVQQHSMPATMYQPQPQYQVSTQQSDVRYMQKDELIWNLRFRNAAPKEAKSCRNADLKRMLEDAMCTSTAASLRAAQAAERQQVVGQQAPISGARQAGARQGASTRYHNSTGEPVQLLDPKQVQLLGAAVDAQDRARAESVQRAEDAGVSHATEWKHTKVAQAHRAVIAQYKADYGRDAQIELDSTTELSQLEAMDERVLRAVVAAAALRTGDWRDRHRDVRKRLEQLCSDAAGDYIRMLDFAGSCPAGVEGLSIGVAYASWAAHAQVQGRRIEDALILAVRDLVVDPTSEVFGCIAANQAWGGGGGWCTNLMDCGGSAVVIAGPCVKVPAGQVLAPSERKKTHKEAFSRGVFGASTLRSGGRGSALHAHQLVTEANEKGAAPVAAHPSQGGGGSSGGKRKSVEQGDATPTTPGATQNGQGGKKKNKPKKGSTPGHGAEFQVYHMREPAPSAPPGMDMPEEAAVLIHACSCNLKSTNPMGVEVAINTLERTTRHRKGPFAVYQSPQRYHLQHTATVDQILEAIKRK
jgi:hypothetical protein